LLEAVADLLADDYGASMGEIASAAHMSRLRFFWIYPTRARLLRDLATLALQDLGDRIAASGLDTAPVPDAIERLARVLLSAGARHVVLVREGLAFGPNGLPVRAHGPLEAIFDRGAMDGTFRTDITVHTQARLFGTMIAAAFAANFYRQVGVEEAAGSVTSVFLDGARAW
jgi:AcrR family transcriptional regulator